MNILNLISVIEEKSFHKKFEFDQVGQTWGLSYIRLVVGQKTQFHSLEQFFFSCFKSPNNMTSYTPGKGAWEDYADMTNWAKGLSVESASSDKMLEAIDYSLKEHQEEHRRHNHELVIDIDTLELPENFESCWSVTETVDAKHFIDTTGYFLGENEEVYVLYESHIES